MLSDQRIPKVYLFLVCDFAIAKRSDWLKNLASVLQPARREIRAIFPRALSKLQVIVRNSDWLIVLFAPVVIGRSKNFGIGFSTVT